MPCIFCIAVFATLGGAAVASAIDRLQVDRLQERLGEAAVGPVTRTVDTGSVARLEFDVAAEDATAPVPVVVTAYRANGRVRIQILSHDLPRDASDKLQDRIADLCDLRILERSDPHGEAKVREAIRHHAAEGDAGRADPAREPLRNPDRSGGPPGA